MSQDRIQFLTISHIQLSMVVFGASLFILVREGGLLPAAAVGVLPTLGVGVLLSHWLKRRVGKIEQGEARCIIPTGKRIELVYYSVLEVACLVSAYLIIGLNTFEEIGAVLFIGGTIIVTGTVLIEHATLSGPPKSVFLVPVLKLDSPVSL